MEQIYSTVGKAFTWVVIVPFILTVTSFLIWFLITLVKCWREEKLTNRKA